LEGKPYERLYPILIQFDSYELMLIETIYEA